MYIFKHHQFTSRSSAEKLLKVLRQQSSSHRCDLLYIQLEKYREPEWPVDGLFNRYFSRFAPYSNAHDYDVNAWNKLFKEFPLKENANCGSKKAFKIKAKKATSKIS